MSINHAILGMLSCKPFTGYDLKKIMQDSLFMPWSGNNNQIYKALLALEDSGLVTSLVQHQDGLPSKKVYTITEAGTVELTRWLRSAPEAYETKKSFLVQLAWADLLTGEELDQLLGQYEQEIQGLIFVEEKKAETGFFKQGRTPRETALWELISENILDSYTSELSWIEKVRKTVRSLVSVTPVVTAGDKGRDREEERELTYQVMEKNNEKYILLDANGGQILTEQDGLDLIAVCVRGDTKKLLMRSENLSDDFLRLSTGVAGAVMQKFANYGIRAAVILEEASTKGRFKEFLSESNAGNIFRAYATYKEAEDWLIS